MYTKTFSGKIWTNLHRVSPGNYFAKNLNKVSFKISRQKLLHLVQKTESECQFLLNLWFFFFLRLFLTLEFFVFDSLHEMNLEKSSNERAPWQAVDSSI